MNYSSKTRVESEGGHDSNVGHSGRPEESCAAVDTVFVSESWATYIVNFITTFMPLVLSRKNEGLDLEISNFQYRLVRLVFHMVVYCRHRDRKKTIKKTTCDVLYKRNVLFLQQYVAVIPDFICVSLYLF